MSVIPDLKKIPKEISTCNLSDAMGRTGSLGSFKILNSPETTVYGRAVTCKTPVGDWWAVAKAIDTLSKGDILVATSIGGNARAILGELLANAAKIRGASAIVIDGSVRDVPELKKLGIPIYARDFVPNAGNPEGKGEIGIPITIGDTNVKPGDIIACDGSGVVCISKEKLGNVIEAAKEVTKKEEAIRKQIFEGKLLSDILNF